MDISRIRPPQGVIQAPALHPSEDAHRDGDPIVLFGTVTAQSGADETLNALSLRNPTQHPIEISEIRLHGQTTSKAISAGIVGVQFILPGGVGVSDNYIPWWLFDRSRALIYGESLQPQGGLLTAVSSVADYVWKLATPLLILPGETLTPKLAHFGLITADIVINVIYSGRVRVGMAIPHVRVVPFAATWQAPSIDFSYVASHYVLGGPNDFTVDSASPENALINSSKSRVIVRRLTGRLVTEVTSTGNTDFSDEVQPIIDMLVNVNMQTSHGYQITRDYIPFRLLFARDTRDFQCAIPLDPGEYLLAQIQAVQGDLVPYSDGGDPPVYTFPTLLSPVVPQIGMIGEREVPL